jgi:hypothetical protein
MMLIIYVLLGWFAGLTLGWRIGMRNRHVNEEQAFWERLAGRHSDQYDWAAELDQ